MANATSNNNSNKDHDDVEGNYLLESFDTPDPEDDNKEYKLRHSYSQHSLNEQFSSARTSSEHTEDGRLVNSIQQNNIHQNNDIQHDIQHPRSSSSQYQQQNSLIREGNSSSLNLQPENATPDRDLTNDVDLESQQPQGHPRRLTTSERIKNVIHHLVPIKQTYERINNGLTTGRMQANTPGRFIGQGTDGVFRNLMAKPDTESSRIEQENNPPSYEEAAADASPEYWESTVISPMYEDEVFVEGLPVGNIANFVWNALVTVAFQFVGFILCYLLHTSHAAKQGSRVGLGITFIVYGSGMIPSNFGNPNRVPSRYEPSDPNSFDINKSSSISTGGKLDTYKSSLLSSAESTADSTADPDSSVFNAKAPYFAYGLIAFGLFIIIKSVVDYYRVKQMEKVILSPPSNTTVNSTTTNMSTNTSTSDN